PLLAKSQRSRRPQEGRDSQGPRIRRPVLPTRASAANIGLLECFGLTGERRRPGWTAASSSKDVSTLGGWQTVNPPPSIHLLGGNFEPELFLERTGHSTSDRVGLPAGDSGDLIDGRSAFSAKHFDQHRLLGTRARYPRLGYRVRFRGSSLRGPRAWRLVGAPRRASGAFPLDPNGRKTSLGDEQRDGVAVAGLAPHALAIA